MNKEILCGNANKFYRCVTCDAPCGSEGHYIEVTEEETLEEAASNYAIKDFNYSHDYDTFMAGAKWQAERMYSEEEVLDILRKSHSIEKTSKMDSWITKQFKQFKKKS